MTESSAPATVPAIEIKKLSKSYGSHVALTDLTLTVNRGEIFGFLGPNGAGKSTAIRTLLGFLRATSGSASLLGKDSVADRIAILKVTGYLPSAAAFEDTVNGYRALDELAAMGGLATQRRAEICESLQLPDVTLRRKVRDYSKGTRQKLAIVQALQHDPELIILDEPTEGLDPLVQHSFYTLLEKLRDEGKTIFFSSHILSEVERVCARVAVIRDGKLVAVEDVQALLAKRRRHVQLRVNGELPDVSSVEGVTSVEQHEGLLTCRLQGDVGPFIRALANIDVQDLIIEPAHLEDVFLEFYGGPSDSDVPAAPEATA